jgi:hypothetical protein
LRVRNFKRRVGTNNEEEQDSVREWEPDANRLEWNIFVLHGDSSELLLALGK